MRYLQDPKDLLFTPMNMVLLKVECKEASMLACPKTCLGLMMKMVTFLRKIGTFTRMSALDQKAMEWVGLERHQMESLAKEATSLEKRCA